MPKKKTNKAAAKRFKVTGSGALTFAKSGRGHLLSVKSRKRKRQMRRPGLVAKADFARINEML